MDSTLTCQNRGEPRRPDARRGEAHGNSRLSSNRPRQERLHCRHPGLRQQTGKQVEAMLQEDGIEPIIAEIEVFGSFQEMVAVLKGEQE